MVEAAAGEMGEVGEAGEVSEVAVAAAAVGVVGCVGAEEESGVGAAGGALVAGACGQGLWASCGHKHQQMVILH